MELSEIVVEGLKGFPAMARVPLAPSLTMVHTEGDRGDLLQEVVLDLLYPQGSDLTLQEHVHPAAQQSRIGILVTGRDGTHYRIMKDVRSGRITMMKMGAQGGEALSDRAPEIAQMVTAQLGFPQRDVLRDLFFTRREDLPSQRPDALEISNPSMAAPPPQEASADNPAESGLRSAWNKPLPPGFEEAAASNEFDFSGLSADAQKAKLAELQNQLEQIAKAKELEFELDGLQKKGFALDERLRPLEHLQRQLADAGGTLERVAKAGELPENLSAQKNEFLQVKAVHEAEVRELDVEVDKIKEQLQRELARTASDEGVLKQAFKDPFIAYGAAAGALALALGMVGFVAVESMRWIALADIIGFGVAVFGAFRFIGDAEHAARLKGQIQRKQSERERMVNKFDLESSAFKSLLKRFGLSMEDVDGVEEEVRAFHEAKHAKAAAEAAVAEALEGESLGTIEAERAALSEQIKTMEEQLYEAGGFMGAVAEIEEQIEALKQSLGGGAPKPPPPKEPVSEIAPTPAAAAPPAGPSPMAGQTAAHLQKLIGQASDVFVTSLDNTCNQLAPRAAQYLAGMSDRRYAQMVFGPKGEVSVVDGASGRAIPFGMLTPGDRDIVYLCLKMTIIEQVCGQMRLPVMLSRAFETFPDVKHPLLVRMLQFLAQGTQVLVCTQAPGIAAAGGQAVALPPPG